MLANLHVCISLVWGYLPEVYSLSSMTIMEAKNKPVLECTVMCSVSLVMSSLPQMNLPHAHGSLVMRWPLSAHYEHYCELSWCIAWYTKPHYAETNVLCTCPALGWQNMYEVVLCGFLLTLMVTSDHVCPQNRYVPLRSCAPACDLSQHNHFLFFLLD